MRTHGAGLSMAVCVLLASPNATAADKSMSSISLEAGKDSTDSKEAYVDLDLGFKNGLHLRGMAGGNRPAADADVFETHSRLAGISSDYAAPLVAAFDYEYWGNDQTLETRTRRFKLGVNTNDWYVQLIYEDRQTTINANGGVVFFRGKYYQLPDSYEVDSTGRGINISYYGLYPWSVSASYIEYEYDRDVTSLVNYPKLMQAIFPASSLGMASGLEAWRHSGDLSYNFKWGAIGVNGSQSESVVDKSIASTGSMYLVWDMDRDWSMTFTAGQSGIDTSSDTTTFGRVALTHRW